MLRGSVLIQEVYDSALGFTSHLCSASRLVSHENWGPSWVFPEYVHNSVYEHYPVHACGFMISSNLLKLFQTSYRQFILQFFFLSFLSVYLPQFLSLPQATAMLNDCHWFFSRNGPEERLFLLGKFSVR